VAEFKPNDEQILLLSRIAANVAIEISTLATGDLETDFLTSINLIHLAHQGYIHYLPGTRVAMCSKAGRIWVHAFERPSTQSTIGVMH